MPPSGSVAVAVQVNVVLVVTLVSGFDLNVGTTGRVVDGDTGEGVGRGDATEDVVARQRRTAKVSKYCVAEEIFAGVPVPLVCLAHW